MSDKPPPIPGGPSPQPTGPTISRTPESELKSIDVFAGTGHHYDFVPIRDEVLRAFPEYRQLCQSERIKWFAVEHAWLRARFGMNEGRAGLWVAIETNVGTIKRGSTYENYVPVAQPPPGTENASPYCVQDYTRLPDEQGEPVVVKLPNPRDKNLPKVPVVEFRIVWRVPSGDPIDIDLVVDFGNTRSVVLALENTRIVNGQLASVCRPIRFLAPAAEFESFSGASPADDPAAIVDSWFILHETVFSNLEPPSPEFRPTEEYFQEMIEEEYEEKALVGTKKKTRPVLRTYVTRRVPQMFVELSPAVMGAAARTILGNLNLEEGGNYSLSSPKRFAWDTDPVTSHGLEWWNMVLNRWNPNANKRQQLPGLAGSMLRFLTADGTDWRIDEPPNENPDLSKRPVANPREPNFPRSDAMTWAALGIIEQAYRQITSLQWSRGDRGYMPRRLRSIHVTFPSGWTTEELEVYERKWQKAVDIFTLAHKEDRRLISEGGSRPDLVMEMDEAVASQLPFIYSEIRRLDNFGENWIELYGRGKGTEATVRVMTVDIGGGTTDISVISYQDRMENRGVEMHASLLFRDSSSTAGDALAKAIIERILLPEIGRRFTGTPDGDRFVNMFKRSDLRHSKKAKWSRVVKLLFLPIVRQWLSDLTKGRSNSADETGLALSPDRIPGVDPHAIDDFNQLAEEEGLPNPVLAASEPIYFAEEEVEDCIQRTFRPVIQSLAKYVAAFEVDLVTLSGKPSELPQVRRLVETLLPILPQRVLPARQYPAGDWYPLSNNQCISDAKTVTAVGAALYQAIKKGNITDWVIHSEPHGEAFANYWGAMPSGRVRPNRFGALYLKPEENQATHRIMVNTCIGRKILPSSARPEQVYRLRWRDRSRWVGVQQNAPLDVTLRRVPPANQGESERLEIADVQGEVGGIPVTRDDVILQLCTLEGDEFWVDSGRFDVVL